MRIYKTLQEALDDGYNLDELRELEIIGTPEGKEAEAGEHRWIVDVQE